MGKTPSFQVALEGCTSPLFYWCVLKWSQRARRRRSYISKICTGTHHICTFTPWKISELTLRATVRGYIYIYIYIPAGKNEKSAICIVWHATRGGATCYHHPTYMLKQRLIVRIQAIRGKYTEKSYWEGFFSPRSWGQLGPKGEKEKGLSFLRLPGNRGSFVLWPVGPPEKLVTWRSRVVVTETRMFKFGLRHRVTPPLACNRDRQILINAHLWPPPVLWRNRGKGSIVLVVYGSLV